VNSAVLLDRSGIRVLEWQTWESRPDGGLSFTRCGAESDLIDAESIVRNIGGATFVFASQPIHRLR
jgi:hypothetical protein